MKNILFIVALFFASQSFAQQSIAVDSVSQHLGQEVKVCADFYGMKETDKVILLNVGAAYPASPLTIVIKAENKDKFKDLISNLRKDQSNLCVTGTITEFKGKMQIEVDKPERLKAAAKN